MQEANNVMVHRHHIGPTLGFWGFPPALGVPKRTFLELSNCASIAGWFHPAHSGVTSSYPHFQMSNVSSYFLELWGTRVNPFRTNILVIRVWMIFPPFKSSKLWISNKVSSLRTPPPEYSKYLQIISLKETTTWIVGKYTCHSGLNLGVPYTP